MRRAASRGYSYFYSLGSKSIYIRTIHLLLKTFILENFWEKILLRSYKIRFISIKFYTWLRFKISWIAKHSKLGLLNFQSENHPEIALWGVPLIKLKKIPKSAKGFLRVLLILEIWRGATAIFSTTFEPFGLKIVKNTLRWSLAN